jgi:hypothetical protein
MQTVVDLFYEAGGVGGGLLGLPSRNGSLVDRDPGDPCQLGVNGRACPNLERARA